MWQHGALEYDAAAKSVRWKGQPVELTPRELALLEVLLANPQRVMSKAQLQDKLYDWSGAEPESNTLEVHVHHLRRKIDPRHRAHRAGRRLRARLGRARAMSLQRRLMLYLLVSAPLVWLMAVLVSVNRAQRDVNELFDTELIRLARQVQVVLAKDTSGAMSALPAPVPRRRRRRGRPARLCDRRVGRAGPAVPGRPRRR